MAVDVSTAIDIDQPRNVVADFAADPTNAPLWYANIKHARWTGAGNLAVGAAIAFVATFLGRQLEYTYVVRELIPGQRLVMATDAGPMAMETTYRRTAGHSRDSTACTVRQKPVEWRRAELHCANLDRIVTVRGR
jgi:hypothetical protein